jgi:hypothetical protein
MVKRVVILATPFPWRGSVCGCGFFEVVEHRFSWGWSAVILKTAFLEVTSHGFA